MGSGFDRVSGPGGRLCACGCFSPERDSGQRSAVRVPKAGFAACVSVTAKWLARLRRVAQCIMLRLRLAVIVDGFCGTQVAPLNWLAFCPGSTGERFPLWRFSGRQSVLHGLPVYARAGRGLGKLSRRRLRWPQVLRTKWLAVALLVLYLLGLRGVQSLEQPVWLTAWIIAGYFAGALAVDGLFRGASFCKYVCPIGQFHFITSLVSPREVAVRKQRSASPAHARLHSRKRDARGCELYLFQPKKASNLDCTFCLDCVKACPHDNVAFLPVLPAKTLTEDPYRSSIGRLSKRNDFAALACSLSSEPSSTRRA